MHIVVFAHRCIADLVWDVRSQSVATGLGNVLGNKGGCAISLAVGHRSFLFVNCHLAAKVEKVKERSSNMQRIFSSLKLRP